MTIEWKRLAGVGLLLLVVFGAMAAWGSAQADRPGSWEECMLNEMRGAPALQSVPPLANTICRRTFPDGPSKS